ncbi:MAG: urease accessory protein UreD [Burkholderiaceae bacterium]|nr:urease accessory protein UreD [Burkholderiaceae bacterium]
MNVLESVSTPSWLARLELDFNVASVQGEGSTARGGLRTNLTHLHLGPLRIQKALYPEGPGLCHAIIVHPPGGIAGGDRLEVQLQSQAQSQALVTTPSAAKWYGTDLSVPATQNIEIDLKGQLEWLPQETIVFDRARVASEISVNATETGAMLGWDHLIFGRRASGETFTTGCFTQSLRVKLSQQLVWHDRLVLKGDDPLFSSPIGLRGHYAFATVWAILAEPHAWTETLLETVRTQSPQVAWTVLHPRLLVGRLLVEPLQLKGLLEQAWCTLRPIVLNRSALPPRLWAT